MSFQILTPSGCSFDTFNRDRASALSTGYIDQMEDKSEGGHELAVLGKVFQKDGLFLSRKLFTL
jgi:hypothetical protein